MLLMPPDLSLFLPQQTLLLLLPVSASYLNGFSNLLLTWLGVDINTASTAVADVLKYHVLTGNISANQITNNQAVATLLGPRVFFNLFGGNVYVNGVNVTAANNYASNGVAHVIERVLTPPTRSIVRMYSLSFLTFTLSFPSQSTFSYTLDFY